MIYSFVWCFAEFDDLFFCLEFLSLLSNAALLLSFFNFCSDESVSSVVDFIIYYNRRVM